MIEQKIDEIMKPVKSSLKYVHENEGLPIGSAFGQLISIVREQHERLEKIREVYPELFIDYKD